MTTSPLSLGAILYPGFDDAPHFDILLLPGGFGTLPELENPRLMEFLAERAKAVVG